MNSIEALNMTKGFRLDNVITAIKARCKDGYQYLDYKSELLDGDSINILINLGYSVKSESIWTIIRW